MRRLTVCGINQAMVDHDGLIESEELDKTQRGFVAAVKEDAHQFQSDR